MREDRLLKLADRLEGGNLPKGFDMAVWDCGTAACAFGHACLMEEFQKAGLRMVHTNDGCCWPEFDGPQYAGMFAASEFFGIDMSDAFRLFSSTRYWHNQGPITPQMVATRIREFCARKKGGNP